MENNLTEEDVLNTLQSLIDTEENEKDKQSLEAASD